MGLIITGHPRSGTTMLQELCARHPEIALTNEFRAYDKWWHDDLGRSWHIIAHWHAVGGEWSFHGWGETRMARHFRNLRLTARYLAGWHRRRGIIDSTRRVDETLHALFPGVRIVGDKWPGYMGVLPAAIRRSDCKPVVIYRDCRDVVASFLKKVHGSWSGRAWIGDLDTAAAIARSWVEHMQLMEAHATELHVMRYEELVYSPQEMLVRFADFLGVDCAGFPADIIHDISVGRYRETLTAEQLQSVQAVAGETLHRYGYPP
jgi:Sulfotransferase family